MKTKPARKHAQTPTTTQRRRGTPARKRAPRDLELLKFDQQVSAGLPVYLLDFVDGFLDEIRQRNFPAYKFGITSRSAVVRLALHHLMDIVERSDRYMRDGLSIEEAEEEIFRDRAWWQANSEAEELPGDHAAEILPISKEGQK